MDFKELIERTKCPDSVRGCKYLDVYDFSCKKCREQTMKDCATVIETLLAEREAAVKALHDVADCTSCRFYDGDFNECVECGAFLENWKWRGPTPPDRKQVKN